MERGGTLLKSEPGNIDSWHMDIFREIANVGAGNAATALATLLDCRIDQTVPKVEMVSLGSIPDIVGGPGKFVVGGMIDFYGDLQGHLLLILDVEQAVKIVSMVCRKPPQELESGDGQELFSLSAMDESALKETLNILAGSYLTAISKFADLEIIPSIPYLCIDMAAPVLSVVIAEAALMGDYALLFESKLTNGAQNITGNLFFIPDRESYQLLLKALGCEE
jgi:chemotaxis protein CheC